MALSAGFSPHFCCWPPLRSQTLPQSHDWGDCRQRGCRAGPAHRCSLSTRRLAGPPPLPVVPGGAPAEPYVYFLSKPRLVSFTAFHFKVIGEASLVAQWLRIRLPMQGTRVPALVQEDPTCRGATKPVRHNY